MVACITDAMNMDLGNTLGESEGQGSLGCCSPWGHEELDMTWRLNNDNVISNSKS